MRSAVSAFGACLLVISAVILEARVRFLGGQLIGLPHGKFSLLRQRIAVVPV
jgi:hypothetical protein